LSGRPLLGPAVGLAVGTGVGLTGAGFPAAAAAAFLLVLSPPLAPAAFAAAGWLAASASRAAPSAPPPAPIVVSGRIAAPPDRLGDRVRFLLRTTDGALLDAFAHPPEWPLALGDRVRFRAELRAPPGPRNPGGRDVAGRLLAGGVALQATAAGPVIREARPSPAALLERARERLAEATARHLPAREAAVVRAIGTGDRAALDPDTTSAFARSGLAHVLAVSGLHLVVVVLGFERVLRALLLRSDRVCARADPRRVSAAVALPLALVYALATGAGAPVLRAAIAAGAVLGAALLDRELDGLNGLALAALLLLGGAPAAALDPGFQLSFAAVAGLVLWAGPLRRRVPLQRPPAGSWRAWVVEPFVEGACATAAASVATAPILAYHFRQVPLLGLLANLAALPVGSGLTVLAALGAVSAAISPALATPFILLCRPLAWALLALADASSRPSWGTLGVGSPGVAGVLGALACAALAGRVRGFARAAAWAAAAAAVLLPAPLRAAAARARGGLEVTFVSVGQGDCALLRLPDGSAALVDAGGAPDGGADPGARDVVPYLRDLGVRRLALVFASHPHPDHVLGLAAVAGAFPLERVFSNGDPGGGEAAAILAGLAPVTLAPGERLERAGVVFEVSGGDRAGLAGNDASLVLRVRHGDTAFLFPGDVEEAGERAAIERGGLAADVVKIPHHGSRTSSSAAFVAATHARFAVAGVAAANRYGFPHAEAVARWRAAGAEVLRTDEGAVRFLSDGRAVHRVPAVDALDSLATLRERP
jgi:competence protein ComEC